MSQLPILMVPGLGCTAEVFAPQIPALWAFGPVTIASTLEGDSIAAIAANILATAPPRFALGGISMGGYLCFEIIRQAPERVVKLALIDTSARPDAPEQSELRRALVARARGGEFEAAISEAFPRLVHPDRRGDVGLAAMSLRMNLAIGLEAFARQQSAIIGRPDSRPTLGAIRVPTLVLVGDADLLTPPEMAQEIAARIAGSRLVVVPRCGHMSPHEQPERVNAALVEWLRQG